MQKLLKLDEVEVKAEEEPEGEIIVGLCCIMPFCYKTKYNDRI